MPQPAAHPVHTSVEVIGRDIGLGADAAAYLLLHAVGDDLVRIEAQDPVVLDRDVVEGPVELDCLIDEGILIDTGAKTAADLQRGILAEGVDDDDVIREIADRRETAAIWTSSLKVRTMIEIILSWPSSRRWCQGASCR
jgi:hypothetical protein